MSFNLKIIIIGIILIIGFSIFGFIELVKKQEVKTPSKTEEPPSEVQKPQEELPITKVQIPIYDYNIIKEVNKNYNENYLVSPLSIAYALTILKEGANDDTYKQIASLLGNYKLGDSYSIKDKISMANALFIKNSEKDIIKKSYITKIQNNYNSDVIFDDFTTPKVINDWISKKTYKMINNTIEDLSSDFVLAIVNAIAIDVEWKNKFECTNTIEDKFTLIDNTTINTPMMNSSDDVYYIESDKAKGIIKDYAIYDKNTGEKVLEENDNTIALEYMAILPNEDIKEYINSLDNAELSKLVSSKKQASKDLTINYSIPRYTYSFNYDKFQKSLINLGLSDMFSSVKADFSNIAEKKNRLHVSEAIHKTHIELNENGTKASAVTVFILDKNTAIYEEKETINIKFNKPFIYIIKEKNSNKIWFFGTVYKPNVWDSNTKSCDKVN